MLLAFVVGGAIVIAVALASEPVYGVVVGTALLGFGAGKLWSDFRHWRRDVVDETSAMQTERRPPP